MANGGCAKVHIENRHQQNLKEVLWLRLPLRHV